MGISADMPELKAESLPLPESPAKIDEPATSSPTCSLQEMHQVITPQDPSADDDDDESSVESAKNAVGTNMPESDTSNKRAAGVRDDDGDSDHETANKDDSKPTNPDSTNGNETVSDYDDMTRSVSAPTKTGDQFVQNESVATTCQTNDQSVNPEDAKREFKSSSSLKLL